MNMKECVSRGCSLQCAMLSPIFRVKEFSVEEAVPYSVNFTWEKEPGEPTTSTVFKRGDPIPSTKMLTFYKVLLPLCIDTFLVMPLSMQQCLPYRNA